MGLTRAWTDPCRPPHVKARTNFGSKKWRSRDTRVVEDHAGRPPQACLNTTHPSHRMALPVIVGEARSSYMEEGSCGGGGGADSDVEAVMARFSLDVSAGCGGRHSTLLDEYERLAFEAQLNRAIVLRRCYSEPSPVRFAPAPAPATHVTEQRDEAAAAAGGGRSWRLHEVLARWLQALKPVFRWLRSAWDERRRRTTTAPAAAAPRRPPPTVPRVPLVDYLR
ncbi:hypothetical protein ACP4OV_028783 [Aristida adscensionis]